MQFREIFSTAILLAFSFVTFAQPSSRGQVHGVVSDHHGEFLAGVIVTVKGLSQSVSSGQNGYYTLSNLQPGHYTLRIALMGFQTKEQPIDIVAGKTATLNFTMSPDLINMKEVLVKEESAGLKVKNQPFAVDVIHADKIRERDVDLNRLLNGVAGVRVKETGGMGSEFNYSIHGLSGKAVKFFIDGIPMENFGTGFSINNFPVNVIERIEVYKGVSPVELGGDALGGSINIVTRKDFSNYLDVSLSTGSFNTQRAALSFKWRSKASGLTLSANAFHNSSANDYKVWGRTVEIAGPGDKPITGLRFRRFNDDYSSSVIQSEIGLTLKKWADEILIGVTASAIDKGIQTGRTMAFVFGDARFTESFFMPTLKYSKKGLLNNRLAVNFYASVNKLNATTIDTGSRKYNWAGEVVATGKSGEIGGINSGRSILSIKDQTSLVRLNLSYALFENQSLNFNFNLNNVSRSGADEFSNAQRTFPYQQPQDLNKQIVGVSYQIFLPKQKWTNIFFLKNNGYKARANVYTYDGAGGSSINPTNNRQNIWGFGYAGKLFLKNDLLFKYSLENTTRLPELVELLGDGQSILISAEIKPERSLNANAALQRNFEKDDYRIDISGTAFYRRTRDLILLGEGDHRGTAFYRNESRINTIGLEAEANYTNKKWLSVNLNATYQDIRNAEKYLETGATNIVYKDRLRNKPFLIANAEVVINKKDLFAKAGNASFYISTSYIHKYFLGWPSMAAKDGKENIPTQFVQDAGITYALKDNRYSISLGMRNVLNQQVYDDFLLQKPGRFSSVKLKYFLK